jgi:hypothetical protein
MRISKLESTSKMSKYAWVGEYIPSVPLDRNSSFMILELKASKFRSCVRLKKQLDLFHLRSSMNTYDEETL